MRNLGFAAIALAFALAQGIVAAPRAATAAEQASEVIAGEVTKIDLQHSRVTVRSSDGQPHEFEASAEMLKTLKVGDQIEAKRRPDKN
jgi:Cu/Ag efflux protein CusF